MSNMKYVCLNFSLHCEQCLKRSATEKAGKLFSRHTSLPELTRSKANQKCCVHTLLFLRRQHIRTFVKTPHGIYPAFTRILINKNINGERMLTTQIVRAVMRVARVRYLLLGAAGAGGVAAKMVSCIYYLFCPFSSQSQYRRTNKYL